MCDNSQGMSPTELKLWAREEVIDAIDAMIADKKEGPYGLEFDDLNALAKERNRVAKFLGKAEKEFF